jgi:hypothetical protein
MLKLLFSLLVGFGFPLQVLAWNAEGHMAVAQIAYNHLDPFVRARCDTLIAITLTNANAATSNFVTASSWADDFRTQLGTANWHYINIPFSLDGTPTNGVGAASFDVVRAINTNIAVLQNNLSTITNQATHLRYLLHFVGDIHQPLHCTTAVSALQPNGDAGGNGFALMGTWANLHFLWDDGGGFLSDAITRPLNVTEQAVLSNKVAAIEANYPYSPNVGVIPNPFDWAFEGVGLCQTVAYVGIVRSNTPSTGYLDTAEASSEERVALAGHRLADLLNTIMAPAPITLGSLATTNGLFRFSWSSSPASTYRVQCKTNLNDPAWSELGSITAISNLVTFSETLVEGRRFYRVTR